MQSTAPHGRFVQSVDIQSATFANDAAGDPVPTWSAIRGGRHVPAEVLTVSGGERVRGQQIEANVTTLVTMHFRDDVTPQMRIAYGSRNLNIVRATDPDNRRRQLVCQCQEVSN